MYSVENNKILKKIECWKIIIPLHDNENNEFPENTILDIKSKIINEFGGLTSINILGAWESNNKIYMDKSIQISVDIPIKDSSISSDFFEKLKNYLLKELKQEKIYVTRDSVKDELITIHEFLEEFGFEVNNETPLELNQDNINKLISQSEILKKRFSYKTLNLTRDKNKNKIIWEREVLGIKIKTEFEDTYSPDHIIISADNIENYFEQGICGSPLLIIGDYEFQSFIMEKEKKRNIVKNPDRFEKYNQIFDGEVFTHIWFGTLTMSEFIINFIEQILINYIILRELGFTNHKILISVGSDGSSQIGLRDDGKKLFLICPAIIKSADIQKLILENLEPVIEDYEEGKIDDIALMQAKALNRFNRKKGQIKHGINIK